MTRKSAKIIPPAAVTRKVESSCAGRLKPVPAAEEVKTTAGRCHNPKSAEEMRTAKKVDIRERSHASNTPLNKNSSNKTVPKGTSSNAAKIHKEEGTSEGAWTRTTSRSCDEESAMRVVSTTSAAKTPPKRAPRLKLTQPTAVKETLPPVRMTSHRRKKAETPSRTSQAGEESKPRYCLPKATAPQIKRRKSKVLREGVCVKRGR